MRISPDPSNSSLTGMSAAADIRSTPTAPSLLMNALNDSRHVKVASDQSELQKTFQDFVGQTFFGQMIASMRATQEDAPYFNGGRAEKIFQGQLDQVLAEELSDSSASQFADPMFKLFQLHRP
jgi:Rod binding domain-containing protein